jgi:hypothetical protein
VDWGTVVPAAITGVVGLAGIGGTLLSARMTGKSDAENLRMSISAEHTLAKLAEKRRIYANCLAALIQNVDVNIRLHAATDSQEHNSVIQERNQARVAARVAIQEVALIGPLDMSDLASQADSQLSQADVTDDANRKRFSLAFARLITAMRADLGEPME